MKQIAFTILMLASAALLLQSCEVFTPPTPTADDIQATALAEKYQKETQQVRQAAMTASQNETATANVLAMTQTALAIPTETVTPTETLTPTATKIPATQTLVPISSASCPLYVYQDGGADVNKFVPEGFMGDISDIKIDENYKLDAKRPSVIQITYKPSGDQQWGGIYWWFPGTAWGDKDGGFDISCAGKLTFWARGENGGENAEFKVGGLEGTYSDSLQPALSNGPIRLTDKWVQYSIDLTGQDLSHSMSGFVWVTNKQFNPNGAVIYLDDIRFEQYTTPKLDFEQNILPVRDVIKVNLSDRRVLYAAKPFVFFIDDGFYTPPSEKFVTKLPLNRGWSGSTTFIEFSDIQSLEVKPIENTPMKEDVEITITLLDNEKIDATFDSGGLSFITSSGRKDVEFYELSRINFGAIDSDVIYVKMATIENKNGESINAPRDALAVISKVHVPGFGSGWGISDFLTIAEQRIYLKDINIIYLSDLKNSPSVDLEMLDGSLIEEVFDTSGLYLTGISQHGEFLLDFNEIKSVDFHKKPPQP